MSDFNRKELISLANMSNNIDLFSAAIDYMKKVIELGVPLSKVERENFFWFTMQ